MQTLLAPKTYASVSPFRETELVKLDRIIEQELITPYYQPVVALDTGTIFAYEALTRICPPGGFSSPEELFTTAACHGLTPGLEKLCRKKALTRATELGIRERLFINVCPEVLQSTAHERGATAALLNELGIERSRVTFELTERTMISDYQLFNRVLSYYRGQGYSIAIDDLGSGYAGLKMLAELEPDYVKLSRFLIDGIDTSATKQALVESLLTFCNRTGARVIAEGIERAEELHYLKSIGITYGQGYLLGKPAPAPVAAPSPS